MFNRFKFIRKPLQEKYLKADFPDVPSLVASINKTIFSYIRKKKPITLYEPPQYLFQGGGKRLRAVMLVLCSALNGRNDPHALHAAAAVEILHNFSLIHDDIMDNDDMRRGRKTIHKKWNPNIAILSGDFLAAAAYKALSRCPKDVLPHVSSIFADGFIELCEGQALDKEFETQPSVTEKDYMNMIRQKTAVLFSTATRIGSILGGASSKQEKALREFGLHFGLAFQIQDDLLDIISDESTFGKNIGSDLMEKKKTYISILASKNKTGSRLLDAFSPLHSESRHRELLAEFIAYMNTSGIRKQTQKRIDSHFKTALKNLNGFKNTSAKNRLLEITHQAWHRSY